MGRSGGGLRDHGARALDHRSRRERPRRGTAAERPGAAQGWRPATSVRAGTRRCRGSARIVEPATLGDPVRPLLWVSKSHDKLAVALAEDGPQDQRQQRVASCCRRSATAGSRTARPTRARSIPTATRSSSTSTPRWLRRRPRASPSSRSTPRRRSWSATTRTAAPTIARRAIRGA